MVMKTRSWLGAAAFGISAALALAVSASAPAVAQGPDATDAEAQAEEAGDRLGAQIERAIRADGPFFTAEERTVIEAACGYPAGSWDGFSANMHDRTFVCTNGRRVDSAEVRAVMRAAGPRIGARVGAVMSSPEVRAAIERVTSEATAAAMAAVDHEEIARIAMEASREAMADAQREVDAAMRELEDRRGRRR
jgi:hypothetical protein